jgi:transcriptional regulator with XRE-family HTH domain
MSLYTEIAPAPANRETWARFFGRLIRETRERKGSIEKIAERAGMTVEEWTALEAGQALPKTLEQLTAISVALDKPWRGMVALVGLCRDAWDS